MIKSAILGCAAAGFSLLIATPLAAQGTMAQPKSTTAAKPEPGEAGESAATEAKEHKTWAKKHHARRHHRRHHHVTSAAATQPAKQPPKTM